MSQLRDASITTASRERRQFWLLVLGLILCYALLQNGVWWPASDSEVYLSLARSLAYDQGYMFNGYPVSSVPPAWPWVLSFLLRITDSFLVLNALNAFMLLISTAAWWHILRRLSSPTRATIILAIGATLFSYFRLATVLFSEPLYCVLFTASIWLALDIREGRPAHWRGSALVLLCIAGVATRWVGVVNWGIVAAILIRGDWRPRANLRWALAMLCAIASIATYFLLVNHLTDNAARIIASMNIESPRVSMHAALYDPFYGLKLRELIEDPGVYLANFLWQPTQLSLALPQLRWLVVGLGSAVLLVMIAGALADVRRKQWLTIAAIGLVLGLAMCFGRPNPRYLVPIAPLILLALFRGADALARAGRGDRAPRRWPRVGLTVLLVSVAVSNLGLYAAEAYVARSPDFYATYRAGQSKDLLRIAAYLNQRTVPRNCVATTAFYKQYGAVLANTLTMRELHMLTALRVETAPAAIDGRRGEVTPQLEEWLYEQGIRYLVVRHEVWPRRIYHFRWPWLSETIGDEARPPSDGHFTLYLLTPEGKTEVMLPDDVPPVTNVPLAGDLPPGRIR